MSYEYDDGYGEYPEQPEDGVLVKKIFDCAPRLATYDDFMEFCRNMLRFLAKDYPGIITMRTESANEGFGEDLKTAAPPVTGRHVNDMTPDVWKNHRLSRVFFQTQKRPETVHVLSYDMDEAPSRVIYRAYEAVRLKI